MNLDPLEDIRSRFTEVIVYKVKTSVKPTDWRVTDFLWDLFEDHYADSTIRFAIIHAYRNEIEFNY